ncbi:MAG: cobyric acid synthase [Planctomycetes bacterium]|nr:cobyric acid synthase [Planctomycetota bacterium]
MTASRHGGNVWRWASASGRRLEEVLDFSANINPLGPPEWLRRVVSSNLSSLVHYPDPEAAALVEAAAARYGVCTAEVIVGNGSTEILHLLPPALQVTRALLPVPSYSDYRRAAEAAGLEVETMPLREEDGFQLDSGALERRLRGGEMVLLGQPNNPTGRTFDAADLRLLAARWPKTLFVVDEAFADFVGGLDRLSRRRPPNLVVVCSLTKFYAIPGLRLGCALADPEVVRRYQQLVPSWSVNTLAQAVGREALRDVEYAWRTVAFVKEQREQLAAEMRGVPGLTVVPGEANFLLVRLSGGPFDAPALARRTLREGILVRPCDDFDGLDARFFRVAVRTPTENARLVECLRAALGVGHPRPPKRHTPAIMFQGTSSNAGKSVLATAFCRILLEDGYRAAPFKAQNMSLNSCVTRDGGEMGRAQVVQAQACRIEPDVRMNPVLLKPNSDTGSQVIVLGKPVGNMEVGQYIRYKAEAVSRVREAYDALAAEFDVLVIEGAGSPAEVNLKRHDIVNMSMARHAASPVLLVGDIDRGGVFASFVGTLEVMAEWERALVAGFIVNRFRGQPQLLKDALEYTRLHTGRPVLGVVPYLQDLGLPEEDSVSFKEGAFDASSPGRDSVEVAVVDLPHISNFTDFDPLRVEPDVRLRIVRRPEDLDHPDAVILPGSKNVVGDIAYLRANGLARKVMELAAGGRTEVVGLCGGFQILGRNIGDPHGIESSGRVVEGLGLLPVETVLAPEKTLRRVAAEHLDSRLPVKGYEIHHGVTRGQGLLPLVRREDGEVIGGKSGDGRVWGSYLHGIFDADAFRRWFVDRLRERRGLKALGEVRAPYDLEPAFERLASAVRAGLELEEIYRRMGLR